LEFSICWDLLVGFDFITMKMFLHFVVSLHFLQSFAGLLAEQKSVPTYVEAHPKRAGHFEAEALPNGGPRTE